MTNSDHNLAQGRPYWSQSVPFISLYSANYNSSLSCETFKEKYKGAHFEACAVIASMWHGVEKCRANNNCFEVS